ncbi:DUF6415 family natural product biosynthesis protein [Streptomyces abikoensis]|uniref:DUF6415 family natural product biosynthesis protein n=1 Tax=Streptomyces abikoensis TaxID=97398 RepID=UPI0016752B2A|nr:DUF6415 family natural product biosynthesis protein [Streptomyces abikoensis]
METISFLVPIGTSNNWDVRGTEALGRGGYLLVPDPARAGEEPPAWAQRWVPPGLVCPGLLRERLERLAPPLGAEGAIWSDAIDVDPAQIECDISSAVACRRSGLPPWPDAENLSRRLRAHIGRLLPLAESQAAESDRTAVEQAHLLLGRSLGNDPTAAADQLVAMGALCRGLLAKAADAG